MPTLKTLSVIIMCIFKLLLVYWGCTCNSLLVVYLIHYIYVTLFQTCMAYTCACRWGHKEIIEYLVKNPNVDLNCTNSSGMTPLYKACRYMHVYFGRLPRNQRLNCHYGIGLGDHRVH